MKQEAWDGERAKVELFEQIRREYEFGVGTIKGIARKLGVHRRMVRQALADEDGVQRARRSRGQGRAQEAPAESIWLDCGRSGQLLAKLTSLPQAFALPFP